MYRLALCVEYDGSSYFGWQRQPYLPTVQANLENALSSIASEQIVVFCAGRTDARVHAIGQVVHFETKSYRLCSSWVTGVNSYLPSDISVHWVVIVDKDFHARFSAISRRYCYIIYNDRMRSAILYKRVTHYKKFLDVNKMAQAGKYLLGKNDFTSFQASGCQSYSSFRHLHHLFVHRYEQYVIIDIKANAFLYHMVRNIVGSLIEVGCNNKPVDWIAELLVKRDRSLAASIAPPDGLYLISVEYPSNFNFPTGSSIVPFF
ncbi:tRNA pseudouridine(38-40) synthase TruA [Blochmannia endosymbiont of Colobopsis nipponica]|uniref:tRNA pseudouridine(38-40) synthase TruA n=1 Tax=Blochmannia endosymbiont of Colobopsis nipponica TaxID=2681987 RepID=UPI0017824841|nr:tRNA pseudouridine(38-40) synthase TruA [Blochmannia endosymbiont of Colobopsis nipponica]QOI11350.1 tRNA pseudouridine(38-40) synthase TruA [Blochmannia endosymbiont of Colobopsis nipponica]